MTGLTLAKGNATACHHLDAHGNVHANEEGYGTSCHFVYVHVGAHEARDLHGPCNSHFFDED